MFNIQEYLNEMVVMQDDEELIKTMDVIELNEILCDDLWLVRQLHFGVAGAMERQIEYLGSTLLPNAEAKLQKMHSNGVIGESYVQNNWFGTTNEDSPHVSEEISFDQQVDDQEKFVEGLKERMRTAGIIMVCNIRSHDEASMTLDQLTYGAIKSKASANRAARDAA
tara:strand:+ start:1134 stop:1634 length:501 start_codon:yes stop_codon:yes gene_type:complete